MISTLAPAVATFRRTGDTVVADLSGDWQLEHDAPRFASAAESALAGGAVRAIRVNGAALGTWDSSLLMFLRQAEDYSEKHKLAFETEALPGRIANLLALAHLVPARVVEPEAPQLSHVARLGALAISAYESSHAAITFTGQVAQGTADVARGRVHMRWREFWVTVQSNATGSLPIVTVIALLIGVIIAFLGVVVLQRFGAGYYVSYLSGFGMLREMGALMTGIIIAGRTGAGFAAEIGSMKITEEIDAYTTLGISPIDQLVLPRVFGIFVMMPLLVIYADLIGILGGLGVAMAMLDLTPIQFITGLREAVEVSDAALGVFKGLIFGLIVGISGCMKGLQAGSDAGAVGKAATSAVVMGITLIIFANAIIDWLAALLKI